MSASHKGNLYPLPTMPVSIGRIKCRLVRAIEWEVEELSLMQIIRAALILCSLVVGGLLATVNCIGSIDRAILGGIGEIALPIITKPLLMLSVFLRVGNDFLRARWSMRCSVLGSFRRQVLGCASGLHRHLRRRQDVQVARALLGRGGGTSVQTKVIALAVSVLSFLQAAIPGPGCTEQA